MSELDSLLKSEQQQQQAEALNDDEEIASAREEELSSLLAIYDTQCSINPRDDDGFLTIHIDLDVPSVPNTCTLYIGVSPASRYPFTAPIAALRNASLPAHLRQAAAAALDTVTQQHVGEPCVFHVVNWALEELPVLVSKPPPLATLRQTSVKEVKYEEIPKAKQRVRVIIACMSFSQLFCSFVWIFILSQFQKRKKSICFHCSTAPSNSPPPNLFTDPTTRQRQRTRWNKPGRREQTTQRSRQAKGCRCGVHSDAGL